MFIKYFGKEIFWKGIQMRIPDFTRFGRGLRPVKCQLPVLSAKTGWKPELVKNDLKYA